MPKIDDLIKKYCPNGVEYINLDKVCSVSTGSQLNKTKLKSIGKYPVINGGILSSGYWEEYNTEKNTITISQGGASAGYVNYMQEDFWAGAHCYVVKLIDNNINYRYLYHFIKNKENELQQSRQGAGIPGLNRQRVYDLKIPVPPMEVQREIVHILDNFTLLTEELTEELTARQKQYEYYRENLFNLNNKDTNFKILGDIATVTKLAGFEFTKYVNYSNEGNIIALRGLNVKNGALKLNDVKYIDNSDFSKLNRSKLKIGDLIFTYVGTVGESAIIEENNRFYLAPNVAKIRFENSNINPYFMKYYFQTNYFKEKQIGKYMNASSMKNLTMENIRKFKVPFPPLEEQERIVSILDRFDKLCNDISEGLPAEIELRKKQYEYYRDKLLTFKELK